MALVAYELLSWIPTVGTRTMGSGKWPTVGVSFYALRNSRAIATLAFLGRRVGFGHLLFVAFSFRGPNFRALKFSSLMWRAPGMNIFPWTGELGASSFPTDHRRMNFNIMPSCVIAAFLKANYTSNSKTAINLS